MLEQALIFLHFKKKKSFKKRHHRERFTLQTRVADVIQERSSFKVAVYIYQM